MRLICLILLFLFTAPAYANEYHRAAVDPAPSQIPDRIVLNWSGDPTTTASITWRTDTSITQAEGQIAEANASANFTTWARSENARTEKWKRNRRVAHFHSVTFKSLKPNTLYAYRVGSGDIWSSWYQFRTASAEPDAFYLYLPWRCTKQPAVPLGTHHSNCCARRTPCRFYHPCRRPRQLFPTSDSDWHEWFESGDWIHAKIPSIPTPGNHEYSNYQDAEQTSSICSMASAFHPARKWAQRALRKPPITQTIKDARIISLNSNERHKEQAPWLEQVLENNPNKWTFVTFHHPVYSASSGRANKDLHEAWKPIFDKYAVDLVLQGHNHTYARGTQHRQRRNRARLNQRHSLRRIGQRSQTIQT